MGPAPVPHRSRDSIAEQVHDSSASLLGFDMFTTHRRKRSEDLPLAVAGLHRSLTSWSLACLHPTQVETWLPDGMFLPMMGSNAERQARTGITGSTAQTPRSDLPRDIHGISRARSRLFMALVDANLHADLHVWRCSPKGTVFELRDAAASAEEASSGGRLNR